MVGFRAIPAWDGRWQSDGRERVVFCGYQRSLSSWPRGGQNIELGNKSGAPEEGGLGWLCSGVCSRTAGSSRLGLNLSELKYNTPLYPYYKTG